MIEIIDGVIFMGSLAFETMMKHLKINEEIAVIDYLGVKIKLNKNLEPSSFVTTDPRLIEILGDLTKPA